MQSQQEQPHATRHGIDSSSTVELLLRLTGGSPLLTYDRLAEVLDRTPNGLRTILCRDTELSRQLHLVKKKIGRRVYFNVIDVARLLDEASADSTPTARHAL